MTVGEHASRKMRTWAREHMGGFTASGQGDTWWQDRTRWLASALCLKAVLNSQNLKCDTSMPLKGVMPFKCLFLRHSLLSIVSVRAANVKVYFTTSLAAVFLFFLTAHFMSEELLFHGKGSNSLHQMDIIILF